LELVSTGNIPSGTRIGAAVVAAIDTEDDMSRQFEDILLISDGDDPAHDEEWRSGLQAARSAGIPVHVVGIGDPVNGHPISGRGDSPFRHKGQIVLTRLDEKPLEEIARATGGSYLPARTETPQ